MRHKKIKRKFRGLLTVSTAIFIIFASGAHAAFPGKNGKMVSTRFDLGNFSAPLTSTELESGNSSSFFSTNIGNFLSYPRFSADGSHLVVSGNMDVMAGEKTDVFILDANGSSIRNVTSLNPADFPDQTDRSGTFPSFHPSGNSVIYTEHWRDDLLSETFCHIFTINLDGTGRQQITNNGNYCDSQPLYSPDGTKIAFLRVDKSSGILTINIADSDGSNIETITTVGNNAGTEITEATYGPYWGTSTTIDWSPDGERIIYATSETGTNNTDETRTSRINSVTLAGSVSVVRQIVSQWNDEALGIYEQNVMVNPQYTPDGQIVFRTIQRQADRVYDADNDEWNDDNVQARALVGLMNNDGSNVRTITSTSFAPADGDFEFITGTGYAYAAPTVQPLVTKAANGSESEGSDIANLSLANTGQSIISLFGAGLLIIGSFGVLILVSKRHFKTN